MPPRACGGRSRGARPCSRAGSTAERRHGARARLLGMGGRPHGRGGVGGSSPAHKPITPEAVVSEAVEAIPGHRIEGDGLYRAGVDVEADEGGSIEHGSPFHECGVAATVGLDTHHCRPNPRSFMQQGLSMFYVLLISSLRAPRAPHACADCRFDEEASAVATDCPARDRRGRILNCKDERREDTPRSPRTG